MILRKALATFACTVSLLSASAQTSQHSSFTPPAAAVPTAVPALVPFAGVAAAPDGKPLAGELAISFLIYKDEQGGEPLWVESQTVFADAAGLYKVQLGAASPKGLPADLFSTGEARWLQVQISGAPAQTRILLASVPYALKAADAATLGGLPASSFALASSPTHALIAAPAGANGVSPNTITNVTTTGGTSGYLPLFNGASTIVNSFLLQNSTGLGIGDTPASGYRLDVSGNSILRGASNLAANGTATTSKGTDSFPLVFSASAYNSSSKAAATPLYYWQAEPQNNNTSSPGATLNLLYNSNNGVGAETGLYLNSNGTVHFPTTQTFAATGGSVAVNGSNSSGIGVEGTSTASIGVEGNSTSSSGVYGHSSTGDGLLGVTVGTALHTAGVFGIAGTGNTSGFNGIAGVWGDASAHVGVLGTSTQYSGVQGQSANSYGVQGNSTTSYGVYGQAAASSGAAAGVYGYASSAVPGVKGASATGDGGDFYAGGGGNGVLAFGAGSGTGVQATGGSTSGSNLAGWGGIFNGGTGSSNIAGGVGIYAEGGGVGTAANATSGIGVYAVGGYTDSGDASEGGVFYGGSTNTGLAGAGIIAEPGYISSSNTTAPYAAELVGNVDVSGTLTADAKNFRIDHPLDPANKYLSHTSIESSEMVNIYSGNVTTNEAGFATVQLPTWFEAVNGDLRYQLTPIGQFAQAMIASEIADSKFVIQTDKAHVKVSWQITGVRHDAYAKAHPLVVEQEKDVLERGFYRHPELYGQPEEKQVSWGRHPKTMRLMQQGRLKNKLAMVAQAPKAE